MIEKDLKRMTPKTIINPKLLREKIQEVQKEKYAIESEELTTELDWGRFLSVPLRFALIFPGTCDPSSP